MSKAQDHPAGKHGNLKERAVEELKVFWIIAVYLAILFGSFMAYRRLVLAEFGVSYLNYGFAIVQALIIAKVILIADALHIGKRFEHLPLAVSVVWKSIIFSIFVMLFGVLEHVVEGLFHKESGRQIAHGIAGIGLDELLARTLMLIAAFIPFFAFWELGRVVGPKRLVALFFSRDGRSAWVPGER
jgi:hypothetical protein